MTAHVPTKQIVDHILSVYAVRVDGQVTEIIELDDTHLTLGGYKFELDKFDVAGLNPTSVILLDESLQYHNIECIDENENVLNHPDWTTEEYEPHRVRNNKLRSLSAPPPKYD